jgi:hypothetical protein
LLRPLRPCVAEDCAISNSQLKSNTTQQLGAQNLQSSTAFAFLVGRLCPAGAVGSKGRWRSLWLPAPVGGR